MECGARRGLLALQHPDRVQTLIDGNARRRSLEFWDPIKKTTTQRPRIEAIVFLVDRSPDADAKCNR
jgi:hypothetical protein